MLFAAKSGIALLIVLVMTSCAVRVLEVTSLDTSLNEAFTIDSPVKAHLSDGSTVVFQNGARVENGEVTGDGRKYDVTLRTSVRISSIPLEEVAAMERYETPIRAGPTAATNVATGVIGGFVAVVVLFLIVAISLA